MRCLPFRRAFYDELEHEALSSTQLSSQKKAHRVLVLETDNLYSGLVVDRAFGMQHFIADSFGEYQGELPDELRQYIKGAYQDASGEQWGVFDLGVLAEDPNFTNAAAV